MAKTTTAKAAKSGTTTKSKTVKTVKKKNVEEGPKKILVIVESPSKAKTINKYLGSRYKVEASVGHIKDLEKNNISVDIDDNFKPKYVTVRGKAPLVKQLKDDASKAKEVLIATDPDREGEAIAWHIANELKDKNDNIKRVLFNEITKNGIAEGLKNPRGVDEQLFMSQQARRVVDRLIGYQASPFLSRALLSVTSQSLSAGRVQSVALRLICEREEEITNFKPIEYHNIFADFSDPKSAILETRLIAFDGKQIKNPDNTISPEDEKALSALHYIHSKAQAEELIARIKKEKFEITDVIKKKVTRRPQAPFTTSSLQQEAARRLHMKGSRTMSIAQKLYEGVSIGSETVGLITYMRTDSVRLSEESRDAAREFIKQTYGANYVPAQPPQYHTKSQNVQDAHEAIRPTSAMRTPREIAQYLDRDEYRLYELIFNRFLASQMAPAILDQTSVNVSGGDFVFRVSGSIIAFKGFLAVYDDIKDDSSSNNTQPGDENSSTVLPEYLAKGMPMQLNKINDAETATKPKPRYSEASLIKELDERGIGRPSTYASIVATLFDRDYVSQENSRALIPTELGIEVNKVLTEAFPDIINVDFTAKLEHDLDVIADGETTYEKTLQDFYKPFKEELDEAAKSDKFGKIICEKCGGEMVIKVSRGGRFLACSNYPECKNTRPLPRANQPAKEEPVLAEGVTCDICGKPMYIRTSRYGKFYGCSDYPKCKGIKPFDYGIKCPNCADGKIIERFNPRTHKSFWGCSNYPDCHFISNFQPVNKTCPDCGSNYMEIHFRKADSEWQKYLVCPKCKHQEDYVEEEKKDAEKNI